MKCVYIETYGCSANQAHSETMKGVLAAGGIKIAADVKKADVVVFNTCIVKAPTENRIRERVKSIVKKYPEKTLVIAGCAADVGMFRDIAPRAIFISSSRSHDIAKLLLGKDVVSRKKTRTNPLVGITEISSGCKGNCAYCIVKIAKGDLKSRKIEEITEDVKNSLSDGCREIWITSQDNSCYGLDIGENLIGLLRKLVGIKGTFRVRVGMMNPAHVMPILNELIDLYKNPKIYKFIHIPVQSGSDKILKLMRRGYSVKDFERIAARFRESMPDITVSTDMIVGFPGESEVDFERTLSLISRLKPDIVNVSKFGPRPGTEAAGMKQLDGKTVKRRSGKLALLVKKTGLEKSKEWAGRECEILVAERGKKGCQLVGRNASYKPVVLECGKADLLGKFVKVRITGAGQTYLRAEIIPS